MIVPGGRGTRPIAAQGGFTLLELLVAIAITVIIGVGATVLFGQTLQNRERVGERAQALADLQRAFVFMRRDFEQTVTRPARDELGDAQSALSGGDDGAVELTRTGWMNPLQTRSRSNLQRVRYRLDGNRLLREYWEFPDRQVGSEPVAAVLLDGVTAFRVQYLFRQPPQDYTWHDDWPLAEDMQRKPAQRRAPLAVSLEVESEVFGTMKWFFRVAANPHARET